MALLGWACIPESQLGIPPVEVAGSMFVVIEGSDTNLVYATNVMPGTTPDVPPVRIHRETTAELHFFGCSLEALGVPSSAVAPACDESGWCEVTPRDPPPLPVARASFETSLAPERSSHWAPVDAVSLDLGLPCAKTSTLTLPLGPTTKSLWILPQSEAILAGSETVPLIQSDLKGRRMLSNGPRLLGLALGATEYVGLGPIDVDTNTNPTFLGTTPETLSDERDIQTPIALSSGMAMSGSIDGTGAVIAVGVDFRYTLFLRDHWERAEQLPCDGCTEELQALVIATPAGFVIGRPDLKSLVLVSSEDPLRTTTLQSTPTSLAYDGIDRIVVSGDAGVWSYDLDGGNGLPIDAVMTGRITTGQNDRVRVRDPNGFTCEVEAPFEVRFVVVVRETLVAAGSADGVADSLSFLYLNGCSYP